MSQPSVQLRNWASCATGAGNATVFGPPYFEAREQEPPFIPRTCSPSLLGFLAKVKCSICSSGHAFGSSAESVAIFLFP